MKNLNGYYEFTNDYEGTKFGNSVTLNLKNIKKKMMPYIMLGLIIFSLNIVLFVKADLGVLSRLALISVNALMVFDDCMKVSIKKMYARLNLMKLSRILQGQEVYASVDNLIKAVHVKEEKENNNECKYEEDSFIFKDEKDKIKLLKEIRETLIDGTLTRELYLLDDDEIDMNDIDIQKIKKLTK